MKSIAAWLGALASSPWQHRLSRRMRREIGWVGFVGLAMIGTALIGGQLAGHGLEQGREALAAQRARLLRAAEMVESAPQGEKRLLAAYYARRFPGESTLPERLAELYAQADTHGIAIRRVDYRAAAEPATPLQRITLDLPVQGDFARIHGWLSAVLVAMPELGLEAISVKRAGSESASIEAELRLVLFVGAGR